MHPNEIQNRLAKAQRLLTTLDADGWGNDPRVVSSLSYDTWDAIAARTGDRRPSEATVNMIAAMIHGRKLAINAIQLHYTPAGRDNRWEDAR